MKIFPRRYLLLVLLFLPVRSHAQSRSLLDVHAWAYQLQNVNVDQIVSNKTFELIVIDYSKDGSDAGKFSAQEITKIKQSGKKVISYLSIGEAEDYRYYWQSSWKNNPPSWLGPENPNWRGNYKVRYWDPWWQAIIFDYLTYIVNQGFDGVYLDIIDGYYYWQTENPQKSDADSLMLRFVLNIRKWIGNMTMRPFYIIPQNGEDVIYGSTVTPQLKMEYFNAIDAVGVEDIFFPGNKNEDNDYKPDIYRLQNLQEYILRGKQIFSIEYLTDPMKINTYLSEAASQKFIPYVTVRALDRLFNGVKTSVESGKKKDITFNISPHPAADQSVITFRLDRHEHVTMRMYNALGREVTTFIDTELDEGSHRVAFRLHQQVISSAHSGVYFIRFSTPTSTQIKKLIVID